MKVVIIGRNGQLSKELQDSVPEGAISFVYGSSDIDITNFETMKNRLKNIDFDVMINSSAYTAVDKAESEEKLAFKINSESVKNMAQLCKERQARFIHVSTDFVFDGTKNSPYLIGDIPNPINTYGTSKLAGEEGIREVYPENSAIVRTSWVYSKYGSNFLKTIIRLMGEKDSLKIVDDQIGSPTSASSLAYYLWELCSVENLPFLSHFNDGSKMSWFEFATRIYDGCRLTGLVKKQVQICGIPTEEFPTPAARPKYSYMKPSAKAKLTFDESLRAVLNNLASHS